MRIKVAGQYLLLNIILSLLVGVFAPLGRALADAPGYLPPSSRNYSVEGVESKVKAYLGNYLLPSEYSVVVRPKYDSRGVSPNDPVETGAELPGAPGLNKEQVKRHEARSYYDTDGHYHEFSDERPAISLDVVVDKSVDSAKVALFKRIIPKLAAIDPNKGDEISVTTGQLERMPPKDKDKPEDSVIDKLMKYKKELYSLIFGILASLAALLVINGFMNVWANRAKHEKPVPPAAPKDEEKESRPKSRLGLDDRQNQFSRDKALMELMSEITEEAKATPIKVARLISQWIQESKAQGAASLMSHFDMTTSERIAENLSSSEMDRMRPFMTGKSDPFSEENFVLMNEARQDLIRISAQRKNEGDDRRFEFLNRLDDEMLVEILRGESPTTVAMVSTLVPANRISGHLKKLSEVQTREFFNALCTLNFLPPTAWAELADKISKRVEAWRGSMVTETAMNRIILNMIHQLSDTDMQKKVLEQIEFSSPALAKTLRESVFFFEDVIQLPPNLLKLILMQVDGTSLSMALSGLDQPVIERLKASMSKSASEIVAFEQTSGRIYMPAQVTQAREQLVVILKQQIAAGTIQLKDVRSATPIQIVKTDRSAA